MGKYIIQVHYNITVIAFGRVFR